MLNQVVFHRESENGLNRTGRCVGGGSRGGFVQVGPELFQEFVRDVGRFDVLTFQTFRLTPRPKHANVPLVAHDRCVGPVSGFKFGQKFGFKESKKIHGDLPHNQVEIVPIS